MDFSCYITIMNNTSDTLTCVQYTNVLGDYNPITLPPRILANQQIFFALEGEVGTQGSVTYYDADNRSLEMAYSCPMFLGDPNTIAISINQTAFYVDYYSTNQPIDWDPNGTNWGTIDNVPASGHPLYILFVVSDLTSDHSR